MSFQNDVDWILDLFNNYIRDAQFAIFVLSIFYIVVNWRILNKAGQGGWKQFIPIYRVYLEFKLYYKARIFWISILLLISWFIPMSDDLKYALIVISVILFLFWILILQFKKAKSFDKGFLFGLGLIIMHPIFTPILAFDSSAVYNKNIYN